MRGKLKTHTHTQMIQLIELLCSVCSTNQRKDKYDSNQTPREEIYNSKMKNTLVWINSRLDTVKEYISKLEDTAIDSK